MGTILDLMSDGRVWEEFYEYKASLVSRGRLKELRVFIDEKRYLPVCAAISSGAPFPLPERSVVSKLGSDKKRVVYTYGEPENTVLKLLTHLMLRKYDGLFSPGLYSFRPGRTAKDAVRKLLKIGERRGGYAFKADVHDYFNSIPVERLLPMLKDALFDDEALFAFLSRLLLEKRVLDRGVPKEERKGIMAGTPPSSFYANLYLSELDRRFCGRHIVYARYSDDVIFFADSKEKIVSLADDLRAFLDEAGLTLNPDKVRLYAPDEGFEFLGFICRDGVTDISPATLCKLKGKMRRKRDALARWQKRSGADGEKAAKAFIRVFNRKLLESPRDSELSWSAWFFPVINTSKSLHEIDLYAQDCLRYLLYGRHTKGRYRVRYEDMKKLGYRSLVHAYYARGEEKKNARGEDAR